MTGPCIFKALEIIESLEEAAGQLDPLADEADARLMELYLDTATDIQELVNEHKRKYGLS